MKKIIVKPKEESPDKIVLLGRELLKEIWTKISYWKSTPITLGLLSNFFVIVTIGYFLARSAGVFQYKSIEIAKTEETATISTMGFGEETCAPVPSEKQVPSNVDAFIKRFYKIAQIEQQKFGIPASITLAQGINESSSGNSYLAVNANNYFGIKCFGKRCYKGHCLNRKDDHVHDRFKIYNVAWESWRDHSILLKRVYWIKSKNPKDWANRLQRKGYATSKSYANDLMSTVKRFNLTKYDLK